MTIINIATNENLLQYHQTKTQLNICQGNFHLPIIRHESRPAADVDFIAQLNEDEGLKETRIQLMYNVVKGKHDPTLMYNVLLRAGPELKKIIKAAFTLPTGIPSKFIPIAYSLPYELSRYCDVINILILSAAGLVDLDQTLHFILNTMSLVIQVKFSLFDMYSFKYQIPALELPTFQEEISAPELNNIQEEISAPDVSNIQNELPAPEVNSFLSRVNWDLILRHTLKTGVFIITASGVAYLIPVSAVLLSICP